MGTQDHIKTKLIHAESTEKKIDINQKHSIHSNTA